MNRYLKELLWFCVPVVLAFLFTIFMFEIKVFKEDIIDINVHDTYLVLSPYVFVIILSVILAIIIYISRVLHHYFKNNKVANYLFIVFQVTLILLFSHLMIFNHMYTMPDYDPQAGKPFYNYPITSNTNMTIIQFLLVALLIYTTYRMGKSKKTS